MTTTTCSHLRKALYRVIIRDGRTQIAERCLDCGMNPRGPGIWVPRAEVRQPIEDLPLLADRREDDRADHSGPQQQSLFAEEP